MFIKEVVHDDDQSILLLSESLNKALLDTGAPITVCGTSWLEAYEDSLSPLQRKECIQHPSEKTFRFGDGCSMKAEFMKKLPITICGKSFSLETHVVNNDLPLLLSQDSMKKAKCVIDLENDKIWIGDRQQDLI